LDFTLSSVWLNDPSFLAFERFSLLLVLLKFAFSSCGLALAVLLLFISVSKNLLTEKINLTQLKIKAKLDFKIVPLKTEIL
jgi:hypothetical protein